MSPMTLLILKNAMSSIEDKWVGFKGIMWNMVQNGKTVVKMEIWVDKNEDDLENGPWVKVDENTDSGGWGNSGSECGGASDQIITWGDLLPHSDGMEQLT